ncbi:hypothetical protein [Gorillibacterium sp. sgz5001074]|uniref:hypothetical protein n=1 Tax=Gorillibacterium sp. sgz5001074 TaxID=3446695 RepID=UPI003F670479
MWKRQGMALLLGFALAVSATACGNWGGSGGDDKRGLKSQAYGRDGLLGTTSSNPNLPGSPTYHTYAADVRLLKDTVNGIQGVKDSTVVLNGATAYVTLELDDAVDIEQSMRIRNSAQASLQRLMPRYDVKVSVGKARLLE